LEIDGSRGLRRKESSFLSEHGGEDEMQFFGFAPKAAGLREERRFGSSEEAKEVFGFLGFFDTAADA
jgi:hypothetical protein